MNDDVPIGHICGQNLPGTKTMAVHIISGRYYLGTGGRLHAISCDACGRVWDVELRDGCVPDGHE